MPEKDSEKNLGIWEHLRNLVKFKSKFPELPSEIETSMHLGNFQK